VSNPRSPQQPPSTEDHSESSCGESTPHAHAHSHSHHWGELTGSDRKANRLIGFSIAITVLFMGIELVAGLYANSLALLSDSAHMLTDVGSMLLSLFAIWLARRPGTPAMSYGYHRAEILGALGSVLLIWLASGGLIYEAFLRLQHPPDVEGSIVFGVASAGWIANLTSMAILHGARQENINIKATYLHLLADSLGSLGAMIAGAVLWFTHWDPIDPLITLFFAVLMMVSSYGLLKETLAVLMESTPAHLDPQAVSQSLSELPGVQELHDLHIWSVSSGRLALSVHLISREKEGLLQKAHELLKSRYQIVHTTIQIEHPDEFQSERCYDCVPKKF
jgi:cobalt-zinc-cadmium efflux system protein